MPKTSRRTAGSELTDADYRRLAQLRTGLRHFLHWSELQAQEAGLTPAQHQLLLAVRAAEDRRGPTIGDVADALVLRHHSAVGLVDRAQEAGFVERVRDPDQRSVVRLRLTPDGDARLRALSAAHLRELRQLAPSMRALWDAVGEDGRPEGGR
jgi:DNA-binding MarR family transcriptional regulator